MSWWHLIWSYCGWCCISVDNHKLSFVDNKSQIGLNRKYMIPGHVFVRSNCSYPTLLNRFTKRYVVCSSKFVVFIQGAGFTFSSQFVLCMCVHVLQMFIPACSHSQLVKYCRYTTNTCAGSVFSYPWAVFRLWLAVPLGVSVSGQNNLAMVSEAGAHITDEVNKCAASISKERHKDIPDIH